MRSAPHTTDRHRRPGDRHGDGWLRHGTWQAPMGEPRSPRRPSGPRRPTPRPTPLRRIVAGLDRRVAFVRPARATAGTGIATLAQRSEPGWCSQLATRPGSCWSAMLAQELRAGYRTPDRGRSSWRPKFWGGTAPCDWVDKDLEADASTVVVIRVHRQLAHAVHVGRSRRLPETRGVAVAYEQALHTLIERGARPAGAEWCSSVSRTVRNGSGTRDRVDAINALLHGFADRWAFVSFVDAARRVEDPRTVRRAGCPAPTSTSTGAADGTTVVRGDGVHFCPSQLKVSRCPVHSSGSELRFSWPSPPRPTTRSHTTHRVEATTHRRRRCRFRPCLSASRGTRLVQSPACGRSTCGGAGTARDRPGWCCSPAAAMAATALQSDQGSQAGPLVTDTDRRSAERQRPSCRRRGHHRPRRSPSPTTPPPP